MKLLNIYTAGLDELDLYSNDLGDLILSKGFNPTCILYVDRAGKYLGYKLSEYFGCRLIGIAASREGGGFKERLAPLLNKLPLWLAHVLRRIEHKSGIHSVKKERNVSFIGPAPSVEDNIVLIDDAIDTGYTIHSILDFLKDHGMDRKKVMVTVVTVTDKSAVALPDAHLFEYPITFPWSPGSRHSKKYELILKKLDL